MIDCCVMLEVTGERLFRWIMIIVCWLVDRFMEVWGVGFERDDLMKRLWMGHYVVFPGILLGLAAFGGGKVWWAVLWFVVFAVMTEIGFRTCLVSEMEGYVKRWSRDGVGNGVGDGVDRWKKKVVRRPWFFMRFVGLGVSCLVIVLLIGWFRGFYEIL